MATIYQKNILSVKNAVKSGFDALMATGYSVISVDSCPVLLKGCGRKNLRYAFHKGFTLIELLVVVLIIGILAAVALPQYQKAVLKSRFVQTQVSIRNLYDALKVYYMANGTYPNDLTELDISLPGTYSENGKNISFPNFYCVYYCGNPDATDSIQCLLNSTTGIRELGTRIFLEGGHQGKLYCTASNSSEKAKSVCVALGGKNPFDSGAGRLHYELP